MSVSAIVVVFYLLILLVLGVAGFLRGRTSEEDYYLAGRRQGWIVTSLTIIATFFSAFAFLGAPGLVYKEGVVFTLFALNVPLAAASVYLLGAPIREIGQRNGYVTPADMISDYYQSPVALRLLTALAGALYAIPYITMQLKAGGELSAVLFGESFEVSGWGSFSTFEVGAVALAIVTVLYVMIGGMRSVAWTDVLQGSFLMGGMLLGGAAVIASYGGFGPFTEALARLPESARTMPGTSGGFPWSKMFTICLLASVGSLVQPAQWMRFYAADSAASLRRGALIFAIVLPCCFLLGVMLVGLGGQALYPLVENSDGTWRPAAEVGAYDRILVVVLDSELPKLLGAGLGAALASLVIVAIMAASMSTADSNLHALSAVAVRDVYDRFIRPSAGEAERVWVGRMVIVGATALALGLVLAGSVKGSSAEDVLKLIALMGLTAIGFAAQLLPVTIDILYLRRGTAAGATWGLTAGLLGAFVFGGMFAPAVSWLPGGAAAVEAVNGIKSALPMDSTAWGLLLNIPVFVALSWLKPRG